ncbi:RHS repeat domain-containing protein [Paraburkholderia xenovorans]
MGEVLRRTDLRHGDTRYRYGATGRIEQAAAAGRAPECFRWDAAANLVSGDHPGGYVEHNRLRMFEDKRFDYDAFGRLCGKRTGRGPYRTQTLEYHAWHQLVRVNTCEGWGESTVRFEYDALGRRILKTNGYVDTDFLWDGMRLLQERHGDWRNGRNEVIYLYEPDSYVPLARIDSRVADAANDAGAGAGRPSNVYYFHNDVSGLPEELTDASGELVRQAQYQVWGNAVQEAWVPAQPSRQSPQGSRPAKVAATAVPQNLRFQGQYLDRETGLHYNTFRFYDPDIGRFIKKTRSGLRGDQ